MGGYNILIFELFIFRQGRICLWHEKIKNYKIKNYFHVSHNKHY